MLQCVQLKCQLHEEMSVYHPVMEVMHAVFDVGYFYVPPSLHYVTIVTNLNTLPMTSH